MKLNIYLTQMLKWYAVHSRIIRLEPSGGHEKGLAITLSGYRNPVLQRALEMKLLS